MKNTLKKIMAILSAALILLSFAACGDKRDTEKKTSTTVAAQSVDDETEAVDVEAEGEEEEIEEETEAEEEAEEIEDEADTTAAKKKNKKTNKKSSTKTAKKSVEKTTKKSDKKTTKKNSKKKATEKTTKKKKTPTEESYSTAEIVKTYNNAANLIKSEKPGYNKKHIQKVMGSTSGIPEQLLKIFTKDNDKNIKKGKSSDGQYPVSGYEWASHMKADDVKTAKMEEKNDKYIINITFDNEKNPRKDASKYGRVMSVIDAEEAKKTSLGLITDISMVYHDGYIKAEIDCKTGKMVSAELSATADIEATLLGGKDLSVKDIRSTETFTNFEW